MSRHKQALKRVAKKIPVVSKVLTDRENLRQRVGALQAEKQQLIIDSRMILSHKFLRGNGVEIGALHMSLSLHPDAQVKYVDYLSVEKLRRHYPELKDLPLVDVDIVDNGEKLTKVKNSSLDFIVANHFLEHCQDPIGTLITFYKKLRREGIIYMAIPDKRYTFDMYRPVTSYAHLLEEHRIFPSRKFYKEHCREVVKLTEGATEKKIIDKRIQALIDANYSIHYHVWTQKELIEFFYQTAKKFGLNIEIEAMIQNVHEVIFIIKKLDPRKELARIRSTEKHYFSPNHPKLQSTSSENKT